MISEGRLDSYAGAHCGKMSPAEPVLHALKDAGEGRPGSCGRGVYGSKDGSPVDQARIQVGGAWKNEG